MVHKAEKEAKEKIELESIAFYILVLSRSVEKRCISCNEEISMIEGSTVFMCPNCGEVEIVRCGRCRKLMRPWKCPNCGFEGP